MGPDAKDPPPKRIALAEAYDSVVKSALKQQVCLTIFAVLLLDGGRYARCLGACLGGFWVGFAIIALRRPFAPSDDDLKLIRWGSIPLAIAAAALAARLA